MVRKLMAVLALALCFVMLPASAAAFTGGQVRGQNFKATIDSTSGSYDWTASGAINATGDSFIILTSAASSPFPVTAVTGYVVLAIGLPDDSPVLLRFNYVGRVDTQDCGFQIVGAWTSDDLMAPDADGVPQHYHGSGRILITENCDGIVLTITGLVR